MWDVGSPSWLQLYTVPDRLYPVYPQKLQSPQSKVQPALQFATSHGPLLQPSQLGLASLQSWSQSKYTSQSQLESQPPSHSGSWLQVHSSAVSSSSHAQLLYSQPEPQSDASRRPWSSTAWVSTAVPWEADHGGPLPGSVNPLAEVSRSIGTRKSRAPIGMGQREDTAGLSTRRVESCRERAYTEPRRKPPADAARRLTADATTRPLADEPSAMENDRDTDCSAVVIEELPHPQERSPLAVPP